MEIKETHSLILKKPISPDPNYWLETFLDSQKIIDIWNNEALCSEVQAWDGEPLERWFKTKDNLNPESEKHIVIGTAYLSENSLAFSNGRHRTKWMLQQGFKAVPVCLNAASYHYAYENGFLIRKAFDGERVF